MMTPDTLFDEVIIDWILRGGDFWDKFEAALSTLNVGPDEAKILRSGANIGFSHIQRANLEYLRQIGRHDRQKLQAEIAGIMRW
jgi:hypothetical protein